MKHTRNKLQRRKEEAEDEGWLITFADMSVLLMSFFILMFALASPDSKQLMNNISASLRQQGFYLDNVPELDPSQNLKKELSLAVAQNGYDQYIAAQENSRGVDVELASSAFFEQGSAKFSKDALPMLKIVAQQLVPLSNQDLIVEVVGHTDDSPVTSPIYPSNWELSAARSANVVRYLIANQFPAAKLRTVGAADTEPKAPNRDEAGNPLPANQNMNRRVVIKIIRGEDN